MQRIAYARKAQRRVLKQQVKTTDAQQFFNLLTSDELFDTVEALLPEHRERQFPPTETLSMFLAQVTSSDRSCQQVVNHCAINRLVQGLRGISTHTGGYCRARQRLPLELVRTLTRWLGQSIDERAPDTWCWQNRPVKIVDGTTVTMPDTVDNQSAYPQPSTQLAGLGFPICRVVGITSLASGALLNAAIGRYSGKGGDEQTLLRHIQHSFVTGDIVLADAFFATYFFIATMQQQGVDILMEQHGARRLSTDFRTGTRLGPKDHLITIKKPTKRPDWMSEAAYFSAPDKLTVREFKAKERIMITTLVYSKQMSKQALADLYKSRWHVELDIRTIKTTLGMETLSCKSAEMVVKEIWVHLLAYNLIRLLMVQSAHAGNVLPRHLSFKHCLQLWTAVSAHINLLTEGALLTLFDLMSQQKVGNRPGRIEPRAVKRRPKPYPLLTKPRDEARAQLMKFGHPSKS